MTNRRQDSEKETISAININDVWADLKDARDCKKMIVELIEHIEEAVRRGQERDFVRAIQATGMCGLCFATIGLTYHVVANRNGIKSVVLKAAEACGCRHRKDHDLHYVPS